jgi:Fe-S oxidoreductase
VSAFRDELVGLNAGNQEALALARQTKFITEFIDETSGQRALSRTSGPALVQVHCHHHAVIKTTAEVNILDRIGLQYRIMPSGCCGMAGSFGFERTKYEVSLTAAERVMLPAIRAAAPETIILANGFSCREQIEQLTGRPTTHVAELLARASMR